MPTQQEIKDSHKLIIDVFKEFRQELMQAYGNVEYSTKSDSSQVTELDVKIETVLKNRLLEKFPAFGFKGEETESVEVNHNATWFIDPIDSTISFIHGLPYCSNMAGLIVNGEIVASIVYHFVTDELYTAFKGEGAYKNGNRIYIKNTSLNNSCVFTDAFSYKNIYQFYATERVKFYAPIGATGYFLTRLAQGSIQGVCYLRANIKQHDIVPGMLIALEAGGCIIPFTDSKINHDCFQFMIGTDNICDLTKNHLLDIREIGNRQGN